VGNRAEDGRGVQKVVIGGFENTLRNRVHVEPCRRTRRRDTHTRLVMAEIFKQFRPAERGPVQDRVGGGTTLATRPS